MSSAPLPRRRGRPPKPRAIGTVADGGFYPTRDRQWVSTVAATVQLGWSRWTLYDRILKSPQSGFIYGVHFRNFGSTNCKRPTYQFCIAEIDALQGLPAGCRPIYQASEAGRSALEGVTVDTKGGQKQ